jgi:ABC-type Fe2+-enterobactin transport system substrate-binding protein
VNSGHNTIELPVDRGIIGTNDSTGFGNSMWTCRRCQGTILSGLGFQLPVPILDEQPRLVAQ